MRNFTVPIIAAAIMMIALAGCEQAGAPAGTPGSITFSMHGRIETDVGAASR